jgi:hypothetical protein
VAECFKPIRVDVNSMRSDRIEEMQEWVKQLGVDPSDVRPVILIDMGEQSYRLHLSKFVRNGNGKRRLDLALNEVVTEPLIVDLGQSPCWPAWLNDPPEAYIPRGV